MTLKKANKILVVVFTNIFLIIFLLETITWGTYPLIFKKKFSRHSIRQKLFSEENTEDKNILQEPFKIPTYVSNKVLHPYLGFVQRPGSDKWQNDYGFPDAPLLKRSEDKVIIAISGGSVAMSFFLNAQEVLRNELQHSPFFKSKDIRFVCIALGGYKQPQQLMALSYFLLLGGEFDMWINLDGFNEITLSVIENWQNHVSPVYPRLWMLFARKSFDRVVLDKMLEIRKKHQEINQLKKIFSGVLSHSIFCLALWEKLNERKEYTASVMNKQIESLMAKLSFSYQVSGPFPDYENQREALEASCQIWMRSSMQMNTLCQSNRIRYYHFLQPNQYHKDSKILNEEERRIAYAKGPYIYKTVAQNGYPLLISYGESLKKSGMLFYDLTQIFKDESRTVYSDQLCHFNQLGNALLAKHITKHILQDYEAETQDYRLPEK